MAPRYTADPQVGAEPAAARRRSDTCGVRAVVGVQQSASVALTFAAARAVGSLDDAGDPPSGSFKVLRPGAQPAARAEAPPRPKEAALAELTGGLAKPGFLTQSACATLLVSAQAAQRSPLELPAGQPREAGGAHVSGTAPAAAPKGPASVHAAPCQASMGPWVTSHPNVVGQPPTCATSLRRCGHWCRHAQRRRPGAEQRGAGPVPLGPAPRGAGARLRRPPPARSPQAGRAHPHHGNHAGGWPAARA